MWIGFRSENLYTEKGNWVYYLGHKDHTNKHFIKKTGAIKFPDLVQF